MDAYGRFSLSKVVNIPVGLANAIVVAIPREYKGIRWLLTTQGSWVLRTAISVSIVLIALAWGLCRRRRNSGPDWLRAFVIACCGTLGLGFLLLLFWDPLYDKLWLQTLWVLALLTFTNAAFLESPSRVAKALPAVLILGCGAINLQNTVRSARGSWPNFDEAARVHAILRPQDFAITEWSSVAMLCRHIWAGDAGSFDFPASTVAGDPLVLEKWKDKSPTHARMEAKSIFWVRSIWNGRHGIRSWVSDVAFHTRAWTRIERKRIR